MDMWTAVKCQTMKCLVPLTVLKNKPYNYRVGDSILIRVRAKSPQGWGPYSETTDFKFKIQADTMAAPFISSYTD